VLPGSVTLSHPRTTRPSVHTGESSVMHIYTYWSDPWTGPKILVFKPKRCTLACNASSCLTVHENASALCGKEPNPQPKSKHSFGAFSLGNELPQRRKKCTHGTKAAGQATSHLFGAKTATTAAFTRKKLTEIDLLRRHRRRVGER